VSRPRRPRSALWLLLRESTPWHRFETAVLLVVAVLTFGTVGYVVVGLGPFDALYQTAITISTVGYGEIGPADEVDRTYRIFTLVLVLVAASSVVYTASVLVETLVEGTINDSFRRRRMQHRVDRLRDHVIVAGWGRVGRSIARYARRQGRPVVALEQDGDVVVGEDDVPVIVGDATDEDALRAAGIDRATSLIAALGDSSANLALVLTARSLREDLRIVARIADDRDARKFIRAGADRVVNPYDIGGSRMAAIAFRPHVAEFLDEVVHSEEHDVDIQEATVAPGSPADGATIEAVCDALVIAVKSSADGYVFGPSTSRRLAAGDVLIFVGAAEQIGRLVTATRASLGPAGQAPI
jgi:voltage-gated potassium channel